MAQRDLACTLIAQRTGPSKQDGDVDAARKALGILEERKLIL